jgi:glycosyltransferase involved in cell wall biosynthesis
MADELQSYFSSPADKLDVIPNGVDPSPFQSLDGTDLNGFRAQWAQPDEKIVLYVGRVVHEKGIEELIRSAPSVLKSVPQARYIIAGRGPELDRLRNLVWEMGLSNKVLLPGFIEEEDRNRLYKVADCAVFPSLYEPFGIVALEAMAAGTPVVVSEVGGLREVVRHAETGITIYPGDPESCAWGIIHTLQHPKWAAQRVENALLDVEQRFNWDIIARQTADVYTRIVEERLKTSW